jgi:hypothetical protein
MDWQLGRFDVMDIEFLFYSSPRFSTAKFILFCIGGVIFNILGFVLLVIGIDVYQTVTQDAIARAVLLPTLPIGCVAVGAGGLWLIVGVMGRTSYSKLTIKEATGNKDN